MKKPILTIENWDTGIADDPYKGFQMVKNLNDNMPGIASCGFYLTRDSFSQVATDIYISADAGTNVISTFSDPGLTTPINWLGSNLNINGRAVTFANTGGVLPAGITAGTIYYTTYVSSSTFKISTTLANVDSGIFVDITDAGSGSHKVTFIQMGQINHAAINPVTGYWYAVDVNGRVWSTEHSSSNFYLLAGNTLTSAAGNGIAVWKNYVLVFRNSKIDAYGPLTSAEASRTWSNDFFSLGVSGSHQAINSLNDKLYWCDGNNVGYLSEDSGKTFNPADNTTFSPDSYSSALDLPDGYTSIWLEDYGSILAIAATRGNKSYIFPWDRVSSSFQFPVEIPETTIQSLLNLNNVLYVMTNSKAAIYATNLSSVSLVKRIPNHLTLATYPVNGNLSIGASQRMGGKIYLGLRAGTTTSGNTGVYVLDPATGIMKLANTLSSGITTSGQVVSFIGQRGQFNDGTPYYFLCSYDATSPNSGAIDYNTTSQYPYGNYESQIISPIYQVSTDVFETTPLTRAIFYFQIPLGVGDAIKLEYRKYDTQAWTELGEITGNTAKADQSPMVDMGFHIDITQVQFRVSLKSTNVSTATFVRLKKIDIF